MDIDVHVLLDEYTRLDGIEMKWKCRITEKLSLKIKAGILFVFIEHKLLEAVCLLHSENVKIAFKETMLAVAYIDQEFVTRFRVVFSSTMKQMEVNEIIGIINRFVPVYKIEGSKNIEKKSFKINNNMDESITKTIKNDPTFKEVPLDKLKQLTEFGENALQKDVLSTLILDPKFLQYVIMLNRTLSKSNEKK